jgi:hypothetical protein
VKNRQSAGEKLGRPAAAVANIRGVVWVTWPVCAPPNE